MACQNRPWVDELAFVTAVISPDWFFSGLNRWRTLRNCLPALELPFLCAFRQADVSM
jgi:hypothetical protein